MTPLARSNGTILDRAAEARESSVPSASKARTEAQRLAGGRAAAPPGREASGLAPDSTAAAPTAEPASTPSPADPLREILASIATYSQPHRWLARDGSEVPDALARAWLDALDQATAGRWVPRATPWPAARPIARLYAGDELQAAFIIAGDSVFVRRTDGREWQATIDAMQSRRLPAFGAR